MGIQNFKTQYNYIKIQHSQRPQKFPLAFHLVVKEKILSKKQLAINTVHKLGCIRCKNFSLSFQNPFFHDNPHKAWLVRYIGQNTVRQMYSKGKVHKQRILPIFIEITGYI